MRGRSHVMPMTAKGEKIMRAMTQEYGKKKGASVFYASANKGRIADGRGGARVVARCPPSGAELGSGASVRGIQVPAVWSRWRDAATLASGAAALRGVSGRSGRVLSAHGPARRDACLNGWV